MSFVIDLNYSGFTGWCLLYTGIATLDKSDLNMYIMQSIGRTMA